MPALECRCEQDVIDAIASGRWPDRADAELLEHVAACAICADVAEVVAALNNGQDESWTEAAVLPPAEIVWYRAQMRARADATRLVGRPIAIVLALGIACALGVIAGVGGTVLPWLQSSVAWFAALAPHLTPAPGGLDVFGLALRGVVLAVAIWLVLAPVAVYLAAADE